ncbi:MAG: hypothetical protein GKR90_18970 [Pseudomonadales bacterium]|nr:hypothetical protein [Pseudomonadales bacterium]
MRWFLLAAITLSVATCGQKGPLELPESQVGIVVLHESTQ